MKPIFEKISNKRNTMAFASWFSRIIRWVLAAGFTYIALKYKDLSILYLFAAIAFVTSFMVPKNCIENNGNT